MQDLGQIEGPCCKFHSGDRSKNSQPMGRLFWVMERSPHPSNSTGLVQLSKPYPPATHPLPKPLLRQAKVWIEVSELISHTKV